MDVKSSFAACNEVTMNIKFRKSLLTVLNSNGISPNIKKHLTDLYEHIGGNKYDVQRRTGKGTDHPSQGDQGDTYRYRVR